MPERICTVSDSLRGVTILDWPGRRRSRSGWISASESFRRGGQPSTTTPTPPPCDSPHVVMRNNCPKLLAMRRLCEKFMTRSNAACLLVPLWLKNFVAWFLGCSSHPCLVPVTGFEWPVRLVCQSASDQYASTSAFIGQCAVSQVGAWCFAGAWSLEFGALLP